MYKLLYVAVCTNIQNVIWVFLLFKMTHAPILEKYVKIVLLTWKLLSTLDHFILSAKRIKIFTFLIYEFKVVNKDITFHGTKPLISSVTKAYLLYKLALWAYSLGMEFGR